MPTPTLLLAVHGTRSLAGASALRELLELVRAARPAIDARLSFVDVLEPSLRTAAAAVRGPLVVVPGLLSAGYHVHDDIPSVLAGRPNTVVARHLGPDPLITDVLASRLRAASGLPADLVALVAVGSSDRGSRVDVDAAAAELANRLGVRVDVTIVGPGLASHLVDLARSGRLAVAPYLLAEGQFADAVRRAAPDGVPVTDPLGPDARLAQLILRRYDEAALTLVGPGPAR